MSDLEDDPAYDVEPPAVPPGSRVRAPATPPAISAPIAPAPPAEAAPVRSAWAERVAWFLTVAVILAHEAVAFVAIGGMAGLSDDWPPAHADHGVHFHHGITARAMFRSTGSLSGYDPSFMAGYPLSIVSDLSSTASDAALLASGDRPAQAYKMYALVCVALVPWLIVVAAGAWGTRPTGMFFAVALYLLYFWTDFPFKYALIGMFGYLASVPLGLVATAALASYCESGGFGRWSRAALACSAVFFVHVTSPMLVGPAGLLAYALAAFRAGRGRQAFPASRHLGFWAIAPVVLLANAYWWLPGYFLASTKGPSDNAFVNKEPIAGRLVEAAWVMPPILTIAVGLAPLGLAVLARRRPASAMALGGFIAAGFAWGYLGGAFRVLDPLQPGRHTYAFYSGCCVAAGIGLGEVFARLRSAGRAGGGAGGGGRLDGWAALAIVVASVRLFGPELGNTYRNWVRPPDRPDDRLLLARPNRAVDWAFEVVSRHVKAGERILFEESGVSGADGPPPFGMVHCSPLLPWKCGVEVIGGPLLHSTVTANFAQFGEGKLFGNPDWDRDFFVRHAKVYRPSAILCWGSKARAFCRANPDLIQILEEDGRLILGRVVGFEGAASRGKATVEAGPNRLVVRGAVADPGDPEGLVVLRYHHAPYLRADPPVDLVPVTLEDDPVPFIGLKPTAGPVTIEMALPLRVGTRR